MSAGKLVLEGPVGATVRADSGPSLLFGSNDYLGLANHPQVVAAAIEALQRYGAGTAMNPPLATTGLHQQLRAEIAAFHGAEDAILFTSCTAANMALADTVAGEGDEIFSDALNHASIIDGCRLSRAAVTRYAHRDLGELARALGGPARPGSRLVITDGVFSMEGTTADLPAMLRLARKAQAALAADESHAAGVLGATGRGTTELQGCLGQVDYLTGTFSKALGGAGGGYICASRARIAELEQRARMAIFSSPMAPSAVAAALAAVRLVRSDPSLVARLHANAVRMRSGLRQIGFGLETAPAPILPLVVGDAERAFRLRDALRARGVFIPAVAHPVVPEGQARLRAQVSAAHAPEDVDRALEIVSQVARQLAIV